MTTTDVLLSALRGHRRHVTKSLEGLSAAQLRAPVPPTTWAPLAAVHHLALDVERWWFQAVMAGDAGAQAYFDANPDGAWAVPEDTDVVSLYDAEAAKSDAVIARVDLEANPLFWPGFMGPVWSNATIIVHVIGETATHAGQLDVVREMVDGHQHLVLD